jgi:hypothetical protein
MIRHQVTSSGLRSVGYDEEHGILEVEFASGEVYQYFDVPVEEYMSLIEAASVGTYFSENIRPNYDFRHVGR